jgi:hypothetical protein
MKNIFQKIMMIIVLAVVISVGFGQSTKASAAEYWRGGTTFSAVSSYEYAFDIGTTDDDSNVNFSIYAYTPDATYNVGGKFYYDAFLMRWNGTSWVKYRWLAGNIQTGETKWQPFTNVPKTGTPTLIWIDFYWAGQGDTHLLGSTTTPAFVR